MADTNASRPPAWDARTLRNPHAQPDKAARVQAMFDAIAPTYERFNSLATFGRDAAWRRELVRAAELNGQEFIVDLCCGTGDLLRAFASATPAPQQVIGVDFSEGMLTRAALPNLPVPVYLVRADALRLPLATDSADVVSCAFGVRNFRELQPGLEEMARIARPGARLLILEFTTPQRPLLRWVYENYCERFLPWLANRVARDHTNAYLYLPRSIRTFDTPRTMTRRLEAAGFDEIAVRLMNFGSVALYTARRR
jgi:demethylmenaquinone methyltransferase/2-methoxy-6-polyprenyl-1,4-benzoquinol methylase